MKWIAPLLIVLVGMLASGCFSHRQKTPKPAPATSSVIVTPDNSLAGKVISYNDAGRFVVLNFPIGRMPAVGQTLFLYRNGLKVAEVKTGRDRRDNLVVADLVTGDAQAGDDARDQ